MAGRPVEPTDICYVSVVGRPDTPQKIAVLAEPDRRGRQVSEWSPYPLRCSCATPFERAIAYRVANTACQLPPPAATACRPAPSLMFLRTAVTNGVPRLP